MLWVKILHVVHLITGVAKTSNPVFLFWLGTLKCNPPPSPNATTCPLQTVTTDNNNLNILL
jgi:hypothetical protein